MTQQPLKELVLTLSMSVQRKILGGELAALRPTNSYEKGGKRWMCNVGWIFRNISNASSGSLQAENRELFSTGLSRYAKDRRGLFARFPKQRAVQRPQPAVDMQILFCRLCFEARCAIRLARTPKRRVKVAHDAVGTFAKR